MREEPQSISKVDSPEPVEWNNLVVVGFVSLLLLDIGQHFSNVSLPLFSSKIGQVDDARQGKSSLVLMQQDAS